MMPAVQIGPGAGTGPGVATAAAAGKGAIPGLGRAPAAGSGSDSGGDGFGSALKAAMADASPGAKGQEQKAAPAASEPAGKTAAQEMVDLQTAAACTGAATDRVALAGRMTPGLPASSGAAVDRIPAEGHQQVDAGRGSGAGENATVSVTKAGVGSAPVAEMDGAGKAAAPAAESGDASANPAVVAAGTIRNAVPVDSTGLENVTVMIANPEGGPDAGATASPHAGKTAGSAPVGKAGEPGGKTGAKKAEAKSVAVIQAPGLAVNGGALPAQAAAAVNPAASAQGVLQPARVYGAQKSAGGEAGSMVAEVRSGVASAGVAAAQRGTAGVKIPGGRTPASRAQSSVADAGGAAQGGSVASGLKENANGAGVAVHAAGTEAGGQNPMGGAATQGSPGIHSGATPGVSGQGLTGAGGAGPAGPGLTATHFRDASNGAAGGGFTATLLQGHPGTGMGAGAPTHAGATQGSASAGAAGAANPYARMDEPQRASLVYASPQKMTVAVSDPSLGSFEVRAQGGGAQVAASLATASAATHAQLSGHLPSLTAFLQDQRVDVSRVTVVQQSLLSGDGGTRNSGGQQQRQRHSGSRDAGAGGVKAVGAAGGTGSGGVARTAASSEPAPGPAVGGRAGISDAGVMSYVDVIA